MSRLPRFSGIPGRINKNTQLQNTIDYIHNNRNKHNLEFSYELQDIIKDMCVDYYDLF